MVTKSVNIRRIVLLRLNPGDDILLSLRKAVEENNIRSGIIFNGLGSIRSYHYHVVADTNLPPKEVFPKEEGPYDVISFSGLIIDGRVHAHISLSDDQKAQGGHLEEGCTVLTFTIVTIADFGTVKMTNWDKIGNL